MKKVALNELTGAAYFSEAVYLDSGYILASPDVPVTREVKNRLVAWGFRNIYTEGEQTSAPPISAVEESSEGPEITKSYEDEQGKKEAVAFYKQTVTFLEGVFDRFKEKDELRLNELTEKVKEIIVELKRNRRFMLSLRDEDSPAKTFVATHSVKTAILALALAENLKMPQFKQIDVGLAGLLHQIGLLKIPDKLYLSDRKLNDQEKKTIGAHPVIGFRMLKSLEFPPNTCRAVLEHNERLDGSGFPRRIKGDDISLNGRILAVASSYNAATSKRPYKPGIDGHAGLMDLLKDAGKRYDEKVLAALVYTLSLFPIGTYVKMSNGAIGIVVKSNSEDPKYPMVKLLLDEKSNRYAEQPVVQTRENDEVTIQQGLSKEEVEKILPSE